MDEELKKYLDSKFEKIDEQFTNSRNANNNRFDKLDRLATVQKAKSDDHTKTINNHEGIFELICQKRKDDFLNSNLVLES